MPTLFDVFTPSSPATGNLFVERPYLNRQLNKALLTPGMQIVVYGSSGTGKSSLVLNKYNIGFDGYVKSICQKDSLFSDLVEKAFDSLNAYYVSEHKKGNSISINGNVSASFWKTIKGELGGERRNDNSTSYNRVTNFKLDESNLAKLLAENRFCWIIEDFHKVGLDEKAKLADSLKLFTDESCKVIAIGAVNSASEVLELNSELENRVSQLLVSTMDHNELIEIIDKGEEIMNINISDEVKSIISVFSSGYAAKCHQLCLNLCETKGILEPAKERIDLGIRDFKDALSDYIYNMSDRYRRKLNKAIKANSETLFLHEEIIKHYIFEMQISVSVYPITSSLGLEYHTDEVEEALLKLTTSEYGEILRKEYNDFKYSFADPFFLYYCITVYDNISLEIPEFNDEQLELISMMNSCEVMRFIHKYDEIMQLRKK